MCGRRSSWGAGAGKLSRYGKPVLAATFGIGIAEMNRTSFHRFTPLFFFGRPGRFPFHSGGHRGGFSALATNFGQGDSGADVAVSQADGAALDAFATANDLPLPSFANVPEPGVLTILAAGSSTALLHRTGRRLPNRAIK